MNLEHIKNLARDTQKIDAPDPTFHLAELIVMLVDEIESLQKQIDALGAVGQPIAEAVPSPTYRDLMVTIEYMRRAVEHSSGINNEDRERLKVAMQVALRINAMSAKNIDDYQHATFWDDVNRLSKRLGIN